MYSELVRTDQLAADLKHSREELVVSRAEAKRKSFFMNAISHDLRTPLNGLLLQTELAEMSMAAADMEGLRESLVEIRASAKATAELLNTFLELGRLDWTGVPNHMVELDVGELAQALVNQYHAFAAGKGLYLRSDVPDGLILRTDRVKLERILGNLIDNAIKFTSAGGVQILAERAEDRVEIAVVDSGIGIDAQAQGRLFEEFFQIQNEERDRKKGFGLGLAIARRLVEQIGGTVTVESGLATGSRFVVSLPGVSEFRAVGQPDDVGCGSRGRSRGCCWLKMIGRRWRRCRRYLAGRGGW